LRVDSSVGSETPERLNAVKSDSVPWLTITFPSLEKALSAGRMESAGGGEKIISRHNSSEL
jgi:hypothetical protein